MSISGRFLTAYVGMCPDYAQFLEKVYGLAVDVYREIVRKSKTEIDAGHDVNHVTKVEELAFRAMVQYANSEIKFDDLMNWVNTYNKRDKLCLLQAGDVLLRVMVATLFHEVGDSKFADGKLDKTKKQLVFEAIDRILPDYSGNTDEFKTDIYNMIDYCGAATWGDRIPENVRIYQLIPRWSDRLEATGVIGIARTITFSYSKRKSGYPLCRDEDEFPTSLDELEKMAPESRWLDYSSHNKKSISGFSHYLDKIVHISGKDVPIPVLRDALNEGQKIVKQFVVDFTVVNDKRFDIDWLVDELSKFKVYTVEIAQLRKLQREWPLEGCKWIKSN